MIGFELLRPELLPLLALSLAVLAVGAWGLTRRRAELAALVTPARLGRVAPRASSTRLALRLALGAAALALLGFAALGPVRGATYREAFRRGLDLVVCIDTSRSMLAQDQRPNRLERAKREVRGLIEALRDDRCALIAFSGDAREVAPLTHDRATLAALLDHVGPEDNRRGGTDLAAALDVALALFDGRTGAHEAVVLLTDGEDLEGRASALAAQAAEREIRVFVVGIGTEGGGKIPVTGRSGQETFLIGPGGDEVVTRLDGTSLAQIAQSTGGEYLSVEMSPTPLEDLYRGRISRLEGREYEGGRQKVPHDRYQWALVLALACMLTEVGMRDARPGRRRRARLPVLIGLGLVGQEVEAPPAFADELAAVVESIEAGDGDEALVLATALVEREPAPSEGELARAHYARGWVLAGLSPPELRPAAPLSFESARALAGPGELRRDATYNLGWAHLAEGERQRALLPEVSGAAGSGAAPGLAPGTLPGAPPPPAGAPGAAGAEDAPDPLELARAAYLRARSFLVERLELDWRDADTRANLELVLRRLRELDEIERQREEQQQQEQEQQQEQQDQQGDESEESDSDGEPQEDPDGEREPNEEDSEGEEAEDREDPEAAPEEPEEPEDPSESEQAQEPEPQPEPEEGQPQEAQPAEPAERHLTREEVMRLLDRLAELEEQGREVEEALRESRRVPVERDW